jgi:small subunit ribosomal protein S35
VAHLPLKDKHAIYKARLIAGVRWSAEPPKNSGLKPGECDEHGYIQISCETFPEAAMNLKWASDVLDRLIAEADVGAVFLHLCSADVYVLSQSTDDRFKDIPYDMRHLEAKAKKAKKGKLKGDLAPSVQRYASPPSIRDFPKSWLPGRLRRKVEQVARRTPSGPSPQVQ